MPHIRPSWLVDLSFVLTSAGVTDRDNAAICGVAIKTIRRWRRHYLRRGQPRGSAHQSAPCPRCVPGTSLDASAYAHLLGWYLGDGHLVHEKRGMFLLCIYNDETYPGLNAEIAETLRQVKPGGRVWYTKRPGCLMTKLAWKHWPCLLPQHGPGVKHSRRIVLESWQESIVEQHPGRFLRGLFHSDGCRITNWTTKTVAGKVQRYDYPRYFFSNTSPDIIGLCTWALGLLDIAWRIPKPTIISVARKSAVAALDRHVGPKH